MPDTIRILCVDDEVNILNTIRRQLCDMDVDVYSTLSAEEGLQFMRRAGRVHVVISDYRMTGMNGIEFLASVSHEWPATTRILLSGFADVNTVQEALAQGQLFALLHKPWKAAELIKTITEAIALSLEKQHHLFPPISE